MFDRSIINSCVEYIVHNISHPYSLSSRLVSHPIQIAGMVFVFFSSVVIVIKISDDRVGLYCHHQRHHYRHHHLRHTSN